MKRVNIIGTTGSGKSTFAVTLANKLGCPYVQLDQLYWKPNWEEASDSGLFLKLREALVGDCWVLDGNYSRTGHIKWERVDTIVWLDFGFIRTFTQLLMRTLVRATTKQELWPGTGNKETFFKSFLSKESILIWCIKTYGKNRARYSELMQSDEYSCIKKYRLQSPKEVNDFLRTAHNKSVQPTAGAAAD